MVTEQQQRILELFKNAGMIYDKGVSNDLIKIYIDTFIAESLTPDDLIKALTIHLRTGKFFPKPVELIEILKPKAKKENKGIEFAKDLAYLVEYQLGVTHDSFWIELEKRWGSLGVVIAEELKHDLRTKDVSDTTFQAQVRDMYNSISERMHIQEYQEALHVGDDIKHLTSNLIKKF